MKPNSVAFVAQDKGLRDGLKWPLTMRGMSFRGTQPSADKAEMEGWFGGPVPIGGGKRLLLIHGVELHDWARDLKSRGVPVLVLHTEEVQGCPTFVISSDTKDDAVADYIVEMLRS